ncbi:DUF2948 family protein [Rhizobium sp. CG4]|uniref:DUF2948 family protein n=1 Tax=Rhizobium sp. CG4 TaxID=2726075 RepID=UPI002033BE42|nr:DUF2948 family protein [Rhizobium sp. CG4]MCM2456041.1 DUF2948 family protein [Rhizobium sp. CG4]
MADLKLLALDGEDLAVISTHMQDSVFKLADASYDAKRGQFALSVNRFVWETATVKNRPFERSRAVLVLKRVQAVRSHDIDRSNKDQVHSLLAIRFTAKGDGPDGTIELTLSGGGAIALDVECIEAQLADASGSWETASMPQHVDE